MNFISKVLLYVANKVDKFYSSYRDLPELRNEFKGIFSGHCMQKLLDVYEFKMVLDIGSGQGMHEILFASYGKEVTTIDYGESIYFKNSINSIHTILADYNEYNFQKQFECIWCSHILEHQLNPHLFLRKIHKDLQEGGILAITVPPLKEVIVGGHVSLWNAGLLLYHLVLAGFDCKNARVLAYGYNISIIIQKKSIDLISKLSFDAGDIKTIRRYLPNGIKFYSTDIDDPFNGNISSLNWD